MTLADEIRAYLDKRGGLGAATPGRARDLLTQAVEALTDRPELDGIVNALTRVLDGQDNGTGTFAHPPLEALRRRLLALRTESTEWFWRIVDADGLTGLPSDEAEALRILVDDRRRRLAMMTPPADVAGVIERAEVFWAGAEDCEATRDLRALIAIARSASAEPTPAMVEAGAKVIADWVLKLDPPYSPHPWEKIHPGQRKEFQNLVLSIYRAMQEARNGPF